MKLIKKIIKFTFLCFIIVFSSLIYLGYTQYKSVINETPIIEKITLTKQKANYTSIDEISPHLLQATVAIEDRRFYQHNGYDLFAIARALFYNLSFHGIKSGASTITQQLAKNLYFDYKPSFIRKISEIFLAIDLEHLLTKDEILELYVNVINYGDNHIGILEASQGYFQIEPKYLNLDQSTLLAGIPQYPVRFQLSNQSSGIKERQKQVLQAMKTEKMITEADIQDILN